MKQVKQDNEMGHSSYEFPDYFPDLISMPKYHMSSVFKGGKPGQATAKPLYWKSYPV
jgi:hypothetical protein